MHTKFIKLNAFAFIFSVLSLFALSLLPNIVLAQTSSNEGVEAQVRAYFSDIPVMIDIAYCESGFRQFALNGQVLRGGGGAYIGIFQINENIHSGNAIYLGYDLKTVQGNMGYARHLYNGSGTNPWRNCVPAQSTPAPAAIPSVLPTPVPTGMSVITGYYVVGMTHPEILVVQQILNRAGFTLASSGPGSPGSETNFFGSLTRDAVRRFQCAKGIVCSGSEGTTGYGRVGPKTRAALNAL